jgi:hypothetical protein
MPRNVGHVREQIRGLPVGFFFRFVPFQDRDDFAIMTIGGKADSKPVCLSAGALRCSASQ